MSYEVNGLTATVAERTVNSIAGKLRVRHVTFTPPDDLFPTVIVAALLLVRMTDGGWVIGHLMVEDDARRSGIAERIVLAIEHEHGQCGACWCSESGEAFGRRFTEKHGPRPLWKLGGYPEIDAALAKIGGRP